MTGRRVLLFITIFLFISFKSFSAVFTVTSNADSGPGTLREALTLAAANGSATKDYINFNLPDLSEAGRTITLLTQLPDISSNLVVDGTTQPGTKFGVSNAKVGLFYHTPVEQYLQGLKISQQHDVAIFGLYLNNLTDVSSASMLYDWSAFYIENSSNIVIGGVGKGNVANNFFNPLQTYALQDNSEHVENLTLKSNFFGIAPDGVTLPSLATNVVGLGNVLGDIIIGGSQAEGNLFATGLAIGQANAGVLNPTATINVKFNNIGVDYSGQTSTHSAEGLMISSNDNNDNYTYHIEDNVLSSKTFAALDLGQPGKRTVVLRNYIGVDRTQTHPLEVGFLGGIFITNDHFTMLIGSDNPADANIIAYCKPLSIWSSNQASFNKNSFFCTHDLYPIYSDSYYQPLTTISITHLTTNQITGIATPNSVVELFYTDDCNTCSPKTYFASANADNNGNWAYNGLVKGSVIASATFNGSTSEFTKPYLFLNIDDSEVNKKPANCGQSDGFIKNIKLYDLTNTNNTYTYSWVNESGTVVGHDLDLTGVPSGTYTLEVKGSGCGSAFSKPIQLQSLTINFDLSNLKTTNAGCNGPTGSITGITAPNATHYQWVNKINNQIAGNSADLKDVGPGTYQLTASNDFGCSEKSIEYTINATQPTTYPVYPFSISKSCAGQSNGSITLITDNLVKAMRWVDANGQPAGTDANPHDLKPGTYKVYFTDANGCETLYAHDFTVADVPPVQIDGNSPIQTNDQCGLKSGSVKNIQVTGGTPPYTYLWVDAAGNQLSTSKDLTGVGEGSYTLQVHDSGSSACSPFAGIAFNISNENNTIDAPEIKPLQLCAPGEALLTVNSPAAGNKYRIYNSLTDPTYLDEQTNGIFKVSANSSSTFYISRVNGQCESQRTQAQITINLSAIDIPNAFTPNGDGKNDYWKISNAQNYPQAIVQVFTRYGQKVFESKGYGVPFDGTYKGSKLPSGVYYYILTLGKSCNLLSGSLSIIR